MKRFAILAMLIAGAMHVMAQQTSYSISGNYAGNGQKLIQPYSVFPTGQFMLSHQSDPFSCLFYLRKTAHKPQAK